MLAKLVFRPSNSLYPKCPLTLAIADCLSTCLPYVCEKPSVPVVIWPRRASAAIMVSTLEMLRE